VKKKAQKSDQAENETVQKEVEKEVSPTSSVPEEDNKSIKEEGAIGARGTTTVHNLKTNREEEEGKEEVNKNRKQSREGKARQNRDQSEERGRGNRDGSGE